LYLVIDVCGSPLARICVWVLYLMYGIPTGDVLIFAHWRLSTLTQYLTWFGKPPTSTGEAITLYRERTRFTTIEEEESSPLWQLSTSLYFSLFSAAMAATAGCLGSPLSPTFLTSLALHFPSHFLIFLSNVCLYL
jgi:hypothetical protein